MSTGWSMDYHMVSITHSFPQSVILWQGLYAQRTAHVRTYVFYFLYYMNPQMNWINKIHIAIMPHLVCLRSCGEGWRHNWLCNAGDVKIDLLIVTSSYKKWYLTS